MTWKEYFLKNGYTKTVGLAHDGAGLYHPVQGTWNGEDFVMGRLETLTEVLGLPADAAPQDTHGAGFLDPSVLDEWAALRAPDAKLPPATENDRDLGRYVSRDGVRSFSVEIVQDG